MTTSTRLAAIKERCAKATEGPWVAVGQCVDQYEAHPDGNRILSGGNSWADDDYSGFTADDCAFIAASREDIPWLVAELEAALRKIEELEG